MDVPGYGSGIFTDIHFKGCKIPFSELMEVSLEIDPAIYLGNLLDQVYTVLALGMIKSSLWQAIDYAKTIQKNGKPLIAHQEYGFMLSEMFTIYEGARIICYRMAWSWKEAQKEAPLLIRCAKVFCSENAEKVSSMALQIMGTDGLKAENTVLRNLLCSRFLQVSGHSTQEARINIADIMLEGLK
jgi:hypothetical protein